MLLNVNLIMKKSIYFIFAAILCFNISTKAAPGDTIWVQANIAQLSWNGNYDSTITFPAPGTSYRKIYMIFTLGKYVCPGSPTYCGDWDYTVDNYLMTPGGDTLDLGRFITPYANAGAPRTPWTWTQHYVYDVTDYAQVLHGSATMRISYSGYSGGFTGNIRFAFIEGTPDRDVVQIKRLWHGYFGYGDTTHHDSNVINVHFPYVNNTAPANTKSAELKFTVTGHGSDVNYCCEFMSHHYGVFLDSAKIDSYAIWRPDCGMNELSPQSGTWLYERANWCPGAIVYSEHHKLPGVTAGSPVNVSVQFDPYASPGGGGYGTEGQLFFYKGLNKSLDASIDQIISPTIDENHFRENPYVGGPVVHVKNTGSTSISSITFQYGIKDSAMQTTTWYGTLDSLKETNIVLDPLYQLNNMAGTAGLYTFVANIISVNGTADDDTTNNKMTSQFLAAPKWPASIKIWFRTNNEFIASDNSICETSWYIYDMYENIVAQRSHATINTTYIDTINLPVGYYKLVIYDSSCDGLNWWANSGTGINSGSLTVKQLSGANIMMHGYQYTGTYNNDFGCGFSQYFSTGIMNPTAITNISEDKSAIEAYPNPAQNMVNIEITGMQQVKGVIRVIDALGRVVTTTNCTSQNTQLNISQLANGVYTVSFINEMQQNKKLNTRILIAK